MGDSDTDTMEGIFETMDGQVTSIVGIIIVHGWYLNKETFLHLPLAVFCRHDFFLMLNIKLHLKVFLTGKKIGTIQACTTLLQN